jgi:predicted RNA-binding protein with PUA-like domain
MNINYWLMKTEPTEFSIDDLRRDGFTSWEGVRNYQARNFIREMHDGDMALFYHSNASPTGIAGICRVCSNPHPDSSAWNSRSKYYDAKSTKQHPLWFTVEVEYVEKFPQFINREDMKENVSLKDMIVLRKGNRLSITPVTKDHFEIICFLGRQVTLTENIEGLNDYNNS